MTNRQAEKIYKTLANQRRIAIIVYLNKKPKATVGQIADQLKLSLKATSKHLQLLKANGLVDSEHISSQQYYFLMDKNNVFIKHLLSLVK
ncbi:MAG TPA: winged helix-turn-helix domain-containing protein [bacterium]|nr:winged helix-turn-helix domain-containing protein [bacterium]HPW39787.1 winged helix-turn-helix domain-containing protein [bacterium]